MGKIKLNEWKKLCRLKIYTSIWKTILIGLFLGAIPCVFIKMGFDYYDESINSLIATNTTSYILLGKVLFCDIMAILTTFGVFGMYLNEAFFSFTGKKFCYTLLEYLVNEDVNVVRCQNLQTKNQKEIELFEENEELPSNVIPFNPKKKKDLI